MDEKYKQKLIEENKTLKKENAQLKKENQFLKDILTNKILFDAPQMTINDDYTLTDEEIEKMIDDLEDLTDETEDMEIISLLSRSKKRLEVLESLEHENKIL